MLQDHQWRTEYVISIGRQRAQLTLADVHRDRGSVKYSADELHKL